LYEPVELIAYEYAKAINRQCDKMKRIMMGAYRTKIAPLIREYATEKAYIIGMDVEKSVLTSNDSGSELERLLKRYTQLADAVIITVMVAIEALFEPKQMKRIVERFTYATNEVQRRILIGEFVEETGIIPKINDVGIIDVLDECEDDNLHFFPLTIPMEYAERVRKSLYEGLRKGTAQNVISSEINEYGAMAARRARNIARNQTWTLFAALCSFRYMALGQDMFMWWTMQDEHVRPVKSGEEGNHRILHGKVFYWDTGAKKAGAKGQNIWPGGDAHEGEGDWGCRCVPRPVFS